MVKSLVSGKIHLTAMRAFPKEEGTIANLCLEFRIFRNIDASVYCNLVLLTAFAAGSESFIYY
jgi:hypothetical protein